MKVKDLRSLLYKLEDDEEVVLLNDAAPMSSTNGITQAVIVSTPMKFRDDDGDETEKTVDKLVLVYSARERGEK